MKEQTYQPIQRPHLSHRLVAFLIRTFLKLTTKFEVRGLENVPRENALIVVANHLNNFDPLVVLVVFPRWVNYMGKEQLFYNRVLGGIMRWARVFPVTKPDTIRGKRDVLRNAKTVLDHGYALGVFPEGKRSRTASLQEALPGPMFIALDNAATLIPVAITGTEKLHGLGWILTHPTVTVTAGKPFGLPPRNGSISKELLASSTKVTMSNIAAILPLEYRGIYGGDNLERAGSNREGV